MDGPEIYDNIRDDPRLCYIPFNSKIGKHTLQELHQPGVDTASTWL